MNDFQTFLSLSCFLLYAQSSRFFPFTLLYGFLGFRLMKLPATSNFKHLLGQELFTILSRWLNHSNFFFVKIPSWHIINNLFLSSTTEIFSSGLILHIHLTILESFFPNLTTVSSLTDRVSLPYSIILHKQAEYNPTFWPKGKPPLG